MKKQKYQATEQYLVGRDQDLKKKLEFVRTQGAFLRKALAPFEWQTKWTQYIISCFQCAALQFPIKESSDELTGEAREWTGLSDLKRIKQLLTQDQMKAICQSIANSVSSNKSYTCPESVIICFEDGTLHWHEMMYMLDDSVIEIEFFSMESLESRPESFVHRLEDKIKGTIYSGEDGGSPRAILKATGDDGNDYFFELSHFSMLYLLDRDNEVYGEEAGIENVEPAPVQSSDVDNKKNEKATPVDDPNPDMDREDGETGMFVLFNMKYDMLFVTTY